MSHNTFQQQYKIERKERNSINKHRSLVVWLMGLSGSGKSTLAGLLEQELFEKGIPTYILDGDNLRSGLNKDLSFSAEDRKENIRRAAEVAKILVDAGLVVITAFISPYKSDREIAKSLFGPGEFVEIFVDCPLEICEQRDTKGLYKKARKGEIKNFTGVDAPFEIPTHPDLTIKTNEEHTSDSIKRMLDYIIPKLSL